MAALHACVAIDDPHMRSLVAALIEAEKGDVCPDPDPAACGADLIVVTLDIYDEDWLNRLFRLRAVTEAPVLVIAAPMDARDAQILSALSDVGLLQTPFGLAEFRAALAALIGPRVG